MNESRPSLLPSTSAPQPRDVAVPDFTSNAYVAFNATITGDISNPANMLAIWSPMGTSFVLRGGYVLVICVTTTVGTADEGVLSFFDEALAAPVLPLGVYLGAGTVNADVICGTHPLFNTRITATPWHFDLGKGYRSLEKDNRLLLGGTLTIGVTGVFRCAGLVWGVQE